MIRGKKGIEDAPQKLIYWTVMGIMWAVCVLFLMLIMIQYKAAVTYFPPIVEDELLVYRFAYAPNCFAYEDGTGRTYAGVIDLAKFNTAQMNTCYSVAKESEVRAFWLMLGSYSIKTNNWQGNATSVIIKPVLVKDGNKIKEDELKFFMQ